MSNENQVDPMLSIKRIIDKAGIDGALTEEAIKVFNNLIAKTKSLKIELKELKTTHDELDTKYLDQGSKLAKAQTELRAFNDREDELEKREESMLRLELIAQYEKERVDDHKEMFSLVFKNLEVRRTVFTPVPGVAAVDQYGNVPSGAQPHVEQDDEVTRTE